MTTTFRLQVMNMFTSPHLRRVHEYMRLNNNEDIFLYR